MLSLVNSEHSEFQTLSSSDRHAGLPRLSWLRIPPLRKSCARIRHWRVKTWRSATSHDDPDSEV